MRTFPANLAVPTVPSVTSTLSVGDRALPAGVEGTTSFAIILCPRSRAGASLLRAITCTWGAANPLGVYHVSTSAQARAIRA